MWSLLLLLIGWVGSVLVPSEASAVSSSPFMQRIEELKRGRLPPSGFIAALEKHDRVDFARAVCRHNLGAQAQVCREVQNPTLGWALCIVAGRRSEECESPRRPSIGFGLCMAAGRDLLDCRYVQGPSSGFGLCMAAGRSFHECTAMSQPNLPFAYCMGRGEEVSTCVNLGKK
ncbi:MAG: hypothetical protein ACOVS5_03815 [Oligoflexus sp.]|jgi:hypothetical protein